MFCKYKELTTYEIPGGYREEGEEILETAKRKLHEKTEIVEFEIEYLCDYSIKIENELNYGRLYVAKIKELESLPNYEISEVLLKNDLSDD